MDKQQQIKLLADAISKANDAAIQSCNPNTTDGGSANLDSVTIRVKGWRHSDIEKVNELASAQIDPEPLTSTYWKGYRFIRFHTDGQGDRRYKQVQAAGLSLNKAVKAIFSDTECSVCIFYQAD